MTPPPPVLLLDVDGVLNALRRDLPEGWRRGTFAGYVLSWDPTVVARLRAWHESGQVELQWLTTWTERADRLLAEPMGLPRGLRTHSRDALPTGFGGRLGGLSGWWKLAAARAVAEAEPGRRIVWIDDDLADQAEDTGEWLAARANVLVVAPDLMAGLTHAELDRVEAWLGEPDLPGREDTGEHSPPPYDEPPTPT
ncbi:HAD domain-containing protein [Blastococcus sp. HT6-30]|uniref:HAD domain-containing protein n=1 Tax=Blastococcus sp. HT6-30 TaxID=3144843 RepID=UPI00321AC5B5